MHLISYQSTISAHCTEQYSSDAPQLSGVDSLQISSQQNWPKKELLLQGSQWEVFALLSNSRSINSGQGKAAHWDATWDFILKMHLCNTWSMTLRCHQAGYVILSLYKQNSLSE